MKKQLPDVTLLAVDCTDRIKGTIKALEICMEHFDFGAVKILTNRKPRVLPENIQYEHIKKISDINQFNHFMFSELTNHVQTSHVLTVQDHAYIINPEVWDDSWLEYDYIGALWLYKSDTYICHDTGEHVRIGNGGFSLRSKKLLDIPKQHNLPLLQEQGWYNEDGNICVYHRKKMLELGVRYAPIEVAAKFSYENLMQDNYGVKPFGFHRSYPIMTWGI